MTSYIYLEFLPAIQYRFDVCAEKFYKEALTYHGEHETNKDIQLVKHIHAIQLQCFKS